MCVEYYGNTIANGGSYLRVFLRGGWGLFFNNIATGADGWAIEAASYTGGCASDWGNPAWNPNVTNTYVFNNTKNGTVINMGVDTGNNYCGIAENRNWYNYNASFSGATGIGRGTTAPTMNCTAGVGYWVASTATATTDPAVIQNGVLYKATAANTWTAYYRPYTFPHPLQSRQSDGQTNAAISLTPPSLSVGSVVVGSSNTLAFTVKNRGAERLRVQ